MSGSRRGVELGHELPVGGTGRCQVLVAFLELEAQVGGLLLKVDDLLSELVDAGGRAEPGLVPGLVAEQLGQAAFKLPDVCVEAGGAFLGGEQVGLQRGTGDGGPAARRRRRDGRGLRITKQPAL